MNLAYFQMLLQESIDNATSTQDLLSLSQALEKLLLGQIRTVATYALLPDAATNEGLLVFVTADERLYWSTGAAWYNLVTDNQAVAWSWGYNAQGNLGNNNTNNTSSPVSVVGGFTDWTDINTSGRHTLGVRTNGTAWAWGCDQRGQLGDNTTSNASSPTSVVGGFTDWSSVSSGTNHSLGLRVSGSVWGWGCNQCGVIGDNTITDKSSPVSTVGGFSDWCQISTGQNHSAAVRTGGAVWAWGRNLCGQLGDNATTNKSSPISVVGGFTDWCQVSVAGSHSLAVRTGGTAWAWGDNTAGRLGDNTTTASSSPVSVVGSFMNWCQISAGLTHSLALRNSGSVWAWGCNNCGQLGDESTTDRSSPVSVVGGFTNWCQVSAGSVHSTAVRTNSTVWSWGYNNLGQLGDQTTTNRSSPVSVAGNTWCRVDAGSALSVALAYDDFV